SDGDKTTSGSALTVTFLDDAPTISGNPITGTVYENELNNVQSKGTDQPGVTGDDDNGDGLMDDAALTGHLSSLVKSGADEPVTFSLKGDPSDLSGLPHLTSHGQAITYSVNGQTLTAAAGGHTVFTLTVENNGDYTFLLQDQLDHPAGQGANLLDIDF